ncbi:hypothetical protein ACFCV3_35585 [Kribbella sp. NPDC056345]|uniref:hypothetical protein n=1 Tax=Kribbella sp. NPDC056345 TaxID=3345789 RepID=UPI0035DC6AE3
MKLGIATEIDVREEPARLPIEFVQGSCALAWTSSPFAPVPADISCWVVLADWLPSDAPVGMFVSVRVHRPADAPAPILDVHSVGAVDKLRGNPDKNGDTIPVLLGRWLFEQKYLTRHSPDRTDSGERWAQKVGGELPARDLQGNADATERSVEAVLERLNQVPWTPAPWPPLQA